VHSVHSVHAVCMGLPPDVFTQNLLISYAAFTH
jgi:hypothetical protein